MPSQSTIWSTALQGIKLTDALRGIRVSPNFLFFVLFCGMFFWLFVVYFIRHHEPFANQVLGTGAARSASASQDRQIVAGVREAFPVRMSANTGSVYVPNTPEVPPPQLPPMTAQQGAFAGQFQSPPLAPAYGVAPQATPQGSNRLFFAQHAQAFQAAPPAVGPGGQVIPPPPYISVQQPGTPLLPCPEGLAPPQASFGSCPESLPVVPISLRGQSGPKALYLPIKTVDGLRLKMVVNR